MLCRHLGAVFAANVTEETNVRHLRGSTTEGPMDAGTVIVMKLLLWRCIPYYLKGLIWP